MWKKFVNDYLRFTRKDRIGILVLLVLIFIVVLLPAIWPAKKLSQPSPQEIEKIKALAARLNKTDTVYVNRGANTPAAYTTTKDYPAEKAISFYFDPNTLNDAGWKRLGIRDRTVSTIRHYISKGGRFKKPEDIGKVYGLTGNDYERLLPFVQIKGAVQQEKNDSPNKKLAYVTERKNLYPPAHAPSSKMIDINKADTIAWIALPGIGSKLAARIISFREKLGGFYAIQQVSETYGLPDSTFVLIKPLLQCDPAAVQQLNINTADANTLKQHPYIRWNLANAIVQYRNQHSQFTSVEDLQQVAIVTPEIFEKIKPYLKIQ